MYVQKTQTQQYFVDFSIHRGKMEQILLSYGLLKETVAAILMLYKNTKVRICSPDRDTYYFDIVKGVLQGDIYNEFRTSIDKMKDNGFKLVKERSRRYPAQIITDADCVDDIALLANIPTLAETLLHSLERAAGGRGLHVKTKLNICAFIKEVTSPH